MWDRQPAHKKVPYSSRTKLYLDFMLQASWKSQKKSGSWLTAGYLKRACPLSILHWMTLPSTAIYTSKLPQRTWQLKRSGALVIVPSHVHTPEVHHSRKHVWKIESANGPGNLQTLTSHDWSLSSKSKPPFLLLIAHYNMLTAIAWHESTIDMWPWQWR